MMKENTNNSGLPRIQSTIRKKDQILVIARQILNPQYLTEANRVFKSEKDIKEIRNELRATTLKNIAEENGCQDVWILKTIFKK